MPHNRQRLGGFAPIIDWRSRYASVDLTDVRPDNPEDEQYMRMAYWELWGDRVDARNDRPRVSLEAKLSRKEMGFLLQFQGGKCGKEMEKKLDASFLKFIRRCRNGGSPATRANRRSYPPQAADAAAGPEPAPVSTTAHSTLVYPDDIIWAMAAFILCVAVALGFLSNDK